MRNDSGGQPVPLAFRHASQSNSAVDMNPQTPGGNAERRASSTTDNDVRKDGNLSPVTPAPEISTTLTSTSGWGWGLLNINTASLYSSMKRDLEELHHQATELASGTVSSVTRILHNNVLIDDARKAAEFVREGVDSVVRSIDETLQINHDQLFGSGNEYDDDDDAAIAAGLTRDDLNSILNDSSTFTTEPCGTEADEFDKWAAEQFDLDAAHSRIERLLTENDHVAKLYEDFVVSDKLLTHNEFWLRYFFRVRQACRERQRQLTVHTLTRRANKNTFNAGTSSDDAILVEQPSSISDAVAADNRPAVSFADHQNEPERLNDVRKIRSATTALPLNGDATRFLQTVVDEECGIASKKATFENDDVYSSASTESFSLVEQDVQQQRENAANVMELSSITATSSSTGESPKRVKRSSRAAAGAVDDDDGWEKEM